MKDAQRYWQISGYQSLTPIFEMRVPVGTITDAQMVDLLKCLTAKVGLTYEEIVGAYAKRKTKQANDLLEVRKTSLMPEYTCGGNPYFVAIVVDEDGKRIPVPQLP